MLKSVLPCHHSEASKTRGGRVRVDGRERERSEKTNIVMQIGGNEGLSRKVVVRKKIEQPTDSGNN